MNEIKTVDSLYEALRLDGVETVFELEKEFARIAGALINDFAIRKADKLYRFVEIEFYHSMADRNEGCDGVTYPRESDALQYFFHKSGMDLTFLSDAERYGGILIRAIRCGDEFINGPYKVADTLFDQFDARNLPSGNYPLIVADEPEKGFSPSQAGGIILRQAIRCTVILYLAISGLTTKGTRHIRGIIKVI